MIGVGATKAYESFFMLLQRIMNVILKLEPFVSGDDGMNLVETQHADLDLLQFVQWIA
jgi:hypothetical protein